MTPAGTNLLLAHADAAPAADPVTKSLRFNDGDAPFLQRTTGTSSDQTKCTHSFWMKRGALGANQRIFEGGSNDGFLMNGYSNSDEFRVNNDGPLAENTTTQLLRDISAFYHICVSIDSALATADQLKLYINGVRVTSFSRTDAIVTNQALNPSGTYATIGRARAGGEHFDGYLADYYMLDGVAAAATAFATEDGTTGQWKPKAYSGSYGNNGFHLDFEDDTDIGNDVSGNDNDFTATNLAASDIVLDNPSAGSNFCLMNPLDGNGTFSECNLVVVTPASGYATARSTFFCPSGTKWYWEFVPTTGYVYAACGITTNSHEHNINPGGGNSTPSGHGVGIYGTEIDVDGVRSGSVHTAWASGNIIGFTYDVDENELKYYINGILNYTYSSVPVSTDGDYSPSFGDFAATVACTINVNFGQDSSFAGLKTAQGNADGNGKGDFYYTPPTGFLALCTGNLPTPTIAKGVTYFDTKIYDDGAGAKTFDNGTVSMQPDLVWAKSRGSSNDHKLTDSVREEQNSLESNTTDTEVAESSNVGVMSFDADGFTIGSSSSTTGPYADQTGDGMVAWAWKKDATAGFNIVGWTGDAPDYGTETQELTHSLGVAPEMIILKGRTDNAGMSGGWYVYHKDLSSSSYLLLNSTDGEAPAMADVITNILPATVDVGTDDSSLYFNYGGDDIAPTDPDTYIGYFFASVAGYSKVGSFSGSSTAFIYTGFRPAFILAKRSDSTGGNWLMFDDQREGYNVDNDDLFANENYDENTTDHIDILSNGFKIRTSDSDLNAGTVIYYAVAKNPFKYASAR